MKRVYVSGCFDDLRSGAVRFLEEASRLGPVTVFLRDDESAESLLGHPPRFSFGERRYFVEALRWVDRVEPVGRDCPPDALPESALSAAPGSGASTAGADALWAMLDPEVAELPGSPVAERASPGKNAYCRTKSLEHVVLGTAELIGFRIPAEFEAHLDPFSAARSDSVAKKAIATGSFDWLHTGHVRFFEEAAGWGELTVVVGHDANIRLLKGEGHPLVAEAERRYMVASIRYVSQALVSSGSGWLDAEPEIAVVKPDRYIVNADGDKDEKRRFCEAHGIEYVVLARDPKPGLPRRSSTDLRGF